MYNIPVNFRQLAEQAKYFGMYMLVVGVFLIGCYGYEVWPTIFGKPKSAEEEALLAFRRLRLSKKYGLVASFLILLGVVVGVLSLLGYL